MAKYHEQIIADATVEALFAGKRKGQVERHLTREQLHMIVRAVVRMARKNAHPAIGHNDLKAYMRDHSHE